VWAARCGEEIISTGLHARCLREIVPSEGREMEGGRVSTQESPVRLSSPALRASAASMSPQAYFNFFFFPFAPAPSFGAKLYAGVCDVVAEHMAVLAQRVEDSLQVMLAASYF